VLTTALFAAALASACVGAQPHLALLSDLDGVFSPRAEYTLLAVVSAPANTFSESIGCPGVPGEPCNLADVTDVGNTGAGPDGQLTVDDIVRFYNLFSEGCSLLCAEE
jgi:hypothetical protein